MSMRFYPNRIKLSHWQGLELSQIWILKQVIEIWVSYVAVHQNSPTAFRKKVSFAQLFRASRPTVTERGLYLSQSRVLKAKNEKQEQELRDFNLQM